MTRRRLVYAGAALGLAGSSIGVYSYLRRDPLAERSQSGSNEPVHVAPEAKEEGPAMRQLKKPVRQRTCMM